MADFVSIKLDGAKELTRQLQALPDKVRDKAFRAALRKGGNIVVGDARERVQPRKEAFAEAMSADSRQDADQPKRRGRKKRSALEKGIVAQVKVNKKESVANIGLSKELLSGYTGRPDPQLIREGFYREYGTLRNPAKPFLRPALDAKEQEVVEAFQESIQAALEKLAYEHRNSVVRR